MWKIVAELFFLTPALALCFGAFVYETRQQVRVARAIREQNKRRAE